MQTTNKLNAISTAVLAFTSVVGVGAALVYYFKDMFSSIYLILLMGIYFLIVELFIYKIWRVIK